MRRFASSFTAGLLLLALPDTACAVDVVGPWNKLVRDVITAHKLGTSDTSRIMASLHLAQFQAVTDLLTTQEKTAADVGKDPQLHTEVLAAVAGAGKAVLEKISYAGQKPEDGIIFAGPVRRTGKGGGHGVEEGVGKGIGRGRDGWERRGMVRERDAGQPLYSTRSSHSASCV
jgi:hypothetical protein